MDQLHIAICDDEIEDLSQALDLVKIYDKSNQLQITTFLRAADLLEKVTQYSFVLLDIEMEPPSGFDIAKALISEDNAPTIIFTTKSNAYALKGYGIAIRYLQKPLMYESLSEALDIAIADATAHRLTIQVDSVLHTVRSIYRNIWSLRKRTYSSPNFSPTNTFKRDNGKTSQGLFCAYS